MQFGHFVTDKIMKIFVDSVAVESAVYIYIQEQLLEGRVEVQHVVDAVFLEVYVVVFFQVFGQRADHFENLTFRRNGFNERIERRN